MKILQVLLIVVASLGASVAAAREQNCDQVCHERVENVSRELHGQRERAENAEQRMRNLEGDLEERSRHLQEHKTELERVRGDLNQRSKELDEHKAELDRVRRFLNEDRETLGRTQKDVEERIATIQRLEGELNENKRLSEDRRLAMQNLETEVKTSKTRIDEMKKDSAAEIEAKANQIEMAQRKMKKKEKELADAYDLVEELENKRFQINVKGITKDVTEMWDHILTFWTGLVMPEKEDL